MTKLPNAESAYIDPRKITGYLLSDTHPRGRPKAAYFRRFGFSAVQPGVMAEAILNHARSHDLAGAVENTFGIHYIIEGAIETPDKRNPVIRSVWVIKTGEDAAAICDGNSGQKEQQVIDELECVVLTHDLPASGLKAGDIGTVVMVYKDGEAYDVEFLTLDGDTFALETLRAEEIRPARGQEVAQAREVA